MKPTFQSAQDAAQAFARLAMPLTDRTGREMAGLIWRCGDRWRLSRPYRGFHNNVVLPVLWFSLLSLKKRDARVIHTHPNCACHAGGRLSGLRDEAGRIKHHGDVTVPGLFNLQGIYCVTPGGEILFYGKDHVCVLVCAVPDVRLTTRWDSRLSGLLPRKYTQERT